MQAARSHTVDEDTAPILLRADPNGLAFDRHTGALYVADGASGAIIRIDGDRQSRIATIESGGVVCSNRIAGLAITPYGTLFVARLGYGRTGAVFRIEPDGQLDALPGLSPTHWRLGVAYDPHDHVLYSTQFSKALDGPFGGCVVEIDLVDGFVSSVIDGFVKPVGVAKLGSSLLVADARQRAVFRVELSAGKAIACRRLAADIDRPDSICACGPESALVSCYDESTRRGAIRQLWLDGRTRTIATGVWEPRGIATDGERVFVAARRASRVLVVPLP